MAWLREHWVGRLVATAAVGFAAVVATLVLAVFGATGQGVGARTAMLLAIPAAVVAAIAAVGVVLQILQAWRARAGDGWGFEAQSGVSWGSYGAEVSGRRRSKPRPPS